MPVHKGKDSEGKFWQWGSKGKKYYYKNLKQEEEARHAAVNQGIAVFISLQAKNKPYKSYKKGRQIQKHHKKIVKYSKGGDLSDVIGNVVSGVAPFLPLLFLGLGKEEHKNIQSVLFDTKIFTEEEAIEELKRLGFKNNRKQISSRNFWRFRQFPPSKFKHYYNKKLKNYPGVELVIGY